MKSYASGKYISRFFYMLVFGGDDTGPHANMPREGLDLMVQEKTQGMLWDWKIFFQRSILNFSRGFSSLIENVFLGELIGRGGSANIPHKGLSLIPPALPLVGNFAWQNISAFSKETSCCPESNFQSQIRAKKAKNGQKISSQPLVLRGLDAGKIQFLPPLLKKRRKDRAEKSDFSSFQGFCLWMPSALHRSKFCEWP